MADNLELETYSEEEIEDTSVSLEEINDELEEILFSLQDLAEKIGIYQSSQEMTDSLQSALRRILDFCSQQNNFTGILEDHL